MTQTGLVSINGYLINMLQLDNHYSQMSSSDCYYRAKSKDPDWFYNQGNQDRLAKVKLKNTSYPWKVKIKSKIVHFKRKRRKFKRRREKIRTSCAGVITFESCGVASEHGDSAGYKKRRSRKAKSVDWGSEAWYKHQKNNQWSMFCVKNESQCKALNH